METLELDRTEPNNTERVELSNGYVATDADTNTPEEVVLSLRQKLAAIRRECSGIGKDNIKMKTQSGSEYTIKGHTIEAVLHSIRGLLDKYKVLLVPQLIDRTYNGTRCDVIVEFEFSNLEDVPKYLPEGEAGVNIRWAGAGTDKTDKGLAKAMTNALKEMLKKTFLITDREDAKEEHDKVEHVTDEQLSAAAAQEAQELAVRARELWASNLRKSIRTAGTVEDVEALKKENKTEIAKLPKVTRDFFEQEFADRIEILEAL